MRYYHQVGLLDEPDREPNGYKRYEVHHLTRLLQIKRLTGARCAARAGGRDGHERRRAGLRLPDRRRRARGDGPLYNPAQVDVLRRAHLLHEADDDGADTGDDAP
ncbi:MerR family transcriptional regulator [Nonomuraea sp. MTCD27]|uniref:MerR family transcriptional regulator n=1 Tax=Nonomuraea sp. MTCD27 TaxID=1676747 RepID=UPI0035C1C549